MKRSALVLLGIAALGAVPYGVYLALGGTLGRERIKTQLAILRARPTIILDAGADSCAPLGTWNASTRTCSMNRDLLDGETIRIRASGVTLDGMGHTLRGRIGPAIFLANVEDATVTNLRITGYSEAVLMFGARRSVVSGLRIDSIGGHAIRVMGDSRYNRIVDNDVRDTELHGVALWQSHGNVIAGNEFVGSRDGVRLQSSSGNAVVNNRTVGSMIEGVDLHLSTSNTIILNDLLEPVAAPLLDDAPPGANTYGVRWGGNYVLRYDAESEGCTDVENDRRCDEPYRFYGHEAPSAMTSALTLDESSPEWDQASVWRSTIDRIADSEQPETICSGCHDFGNGEGADIGPPLQGIVGKQVASGAFEYSPGLSQLGGTWTRERLAAFIRNPQELAPGTTMSFPGIDDEAVIRAIVDYLAEGS